MERIQNLRNQKQEKPKSEEKHPYGFPFKPYQVQLDLMDKIYDTLSQEKKIGLFESPTGTGKSLSLVCAILTWYLGKDKQVKCEKSDIKKDAKEDDWLSMFGAPVTNEVSNKPQVRNLNQKRVFKNLNSNDIREVQQNLKRKKEARLVNQSQQPNLNDEHLLNYDSDKEKTQQKLKQISQKAKSLGQSSNNHHQLNSLQQSAKEQQIIFCTRTHSQISQIINEIKRVEYSQEISVVPINHIQCMRSLKIQQARIYSMKNVFNHFQLDIFSNIVLVRNKYIRITCQNRKKYKISNLSQYTSTRDSLGISLQIFNKL